MAKIEKFEDIESWTMGREVAKRVYELTSNGRFSKYFALCGQIRRATISIISNIAEGFERGGNKEFLNFLAMAKGSCGEVRCQLYAALDQSYVDQREFDALISKLNETSRLISGLMNYLKQSDFRGSKFET